MIEILDVEAVVERCNLKQLTKTENGWRAENPYEMQEKESSEPTLAISKTGATFCHRTRKSHGDVVNLYSYVKGISLGEAFSELKGFGYIESNEIPTHSNIEKPKTIAQELEKSDSQDELQKLVAKVIPVDWTLLGLWRGMTDRVFSECATINSFGYTDKFPGFGEAYCFICSTPPTKDIMSEDAAIHARSAIFDCEKKDRWRSQGAYGIWVPYWNMQAKVVYLFEGGWDAMAALDTFQKLSPKSLPDIQIMALSGSKKFNDRPEMMLYFKGKTVIQIPDNDGKEPGAAGEEILCRTAEHLKQTGCTHKILRLPKQVRQDCKDFNDWLKKGIQKDDFEIWKDSADEFYVSNGIVVDSECREEFNLSPESVVEFNDDGEPVELFKEKAVLHPVTLDEDIFALVKPYPMAAEYIRNCYETMEAPVKWQFSAYFAFKAGVYARRWRSPTGIFPNVYVANVGPSGMGKNVAIGTLKGIIAKVNPFMFTPEQMSYESFIDVLAEQPHRMMVFTEFSTWYGAKSTSDYRNNVVRALRLIHDTHEWTDDMPYRAQFRKVEATIKSPCLTVLCAGTPDQFRVNESALKDGDMGRYMFFYAHKKSRRIAMPKGLHPSFKRKLEEHFKAIALTPYRSDAIDVGAPRCTFSPGAMRIYNDGFNATEDKIEAENSIMAEVGGNKSRWGVQVQKWAMLFELEMPDKTWPRTEASFIVSEQAMASAIKVVAMMERDYEFLFEDQFSPLTCTREEKIQKKILEFLRRNMTENGVPYVDIMRSTHSTKSIMDQNIEYLRSAGYIFIKKIANKKSRPKQVVFLIKDK